MRNEDLVAEIKKLADASGSQDRQRLQRLKDQLFEKNREAILKTARYYNRGRRVTEDESQNAYLSLFVAVEKYDESKGATFATFLGFYVQSAIQKQHAFSHPRQSQSMYARAKGKLNNPENHGRDAVNRAEAQLWSDKPFTEETVSSSTSQLSAEEFFFAITEQAFDEAKNERMLDLAREAILSLSEEEQTVLVSMLDPNRATTEYGLRTNEAITKDIHLDELSVEVDRQRVFMTVRRYIYEHDSSLTPPGWTGEEDSGIQLPGTETWIQGLFGTPTSGEVRNYFRATGRGRSSSSHIASAHKNSETREEGDPDREAEAILTLFPEENVSPEEKEVQAQDLKPEMPENSDSEGKEASFGLRMRF